MPVYAERLNSATLAASSCNPVALMAMITGAQVEERASEVKIPATQAGGELAQVSAGPVLVRGKANC
jgi:hypothetical protein